MKIVASVYHNGVKNVLGRISINAKAKTTLVSCMLSTVCFTLGNHMKAYNVLNKDSESENILLQ